MSLILVVDDDKQIVRLVQSYLSQAGYQVLTAHNGETALHTIRRDHPDLVVLDVMLPDRDGWEILRLVRNEPNLATLPVILLTARVEDTDKIVGLELGADDYITKPFNPREVVARVRAVLRRASGSPAPQKIIQIGQLRLDADSHRVTFADQPLELTPSEFDLLKIFLDNPDHVFTRLELIEKALGGYAYEGMERTVDSHIKNLRRKIEPDPRNPTYIETVYGIGYKLAIDPKGLPPLERVS